MKSLPQDAVLLIIDVQKGFDEPVWGNRNNTDAESQIEILLRAWRASGRPVYHAQHLSLMPNSPLRADNPGSAIKDAVQPVDGEPLFQKHVNSAFIGTELEETLRANGHDTLVIVGLTTPHCVSTTTRMAGNYGFIVYLVEDAVAAFDLSAPDGTIIPAEEIHRVSLTALHGEFATVVSTESVLAAL